MKKIIIPLILVAVFIVGVGLLTRYLQDRNLSVGFPNSTPGEMKNQVEIGDIKIDVELADSDEERKKGLSNRASLPENEGILFEFSKKDTRPTFWMKDMLIAIDMIWIDNDKVVQIDANVTPPEPDTPNSKLTLYTPDQQIDYVLEVNAGFSEKHNIEVGDKVNLSGVIQ